MNGANQTLINAISRGYDPAARENELNALQMQRNTLSQQPQDIAWQNQQRQMAIQEFKDRQATKGFTKAKETVDYLLKMMPFTNYQNHDQIKNFLETNGFPKDSLPPSSSFKDEGAYKVWKDNMHRALIGKKDKMIVPAGSSVYDPEQGIAEYTAPDKITGYKPTTQEEALGFERGKEKIKSEFKDTGDKSQTEEQLTAKALKGDKDAQAILDAMQKRKLSIAEAMRQFTNPEPFHTWSKDEKEFWFERVTKGGEGPRFGFGDRASYSAFNKELATYSKGQGISGEEAVGIKAETRALQASLTKQETIRGMMGGFVRNINKQVDRMDEISKDIISRVGARFVDYPVRQLKIKAKGSGAENIIEAYLVEISNEIAKLSTGSAASIAELSIAAQDRWAKIHDPNLSIKEMKKILAETKQMANMRLSSSDEEIKRTKGLLSAKPGKVTPIGETPTGKKKTITLKSGKVIEVEE